MVKNLQLRGCDPAECLADGMIGMGAGLATLAPIILLIELAEWSLTGQWPGWSVEDGLLFVGLDEPLGYFDLTQFILDILTDLPLAIGTWLAGFTSVVLALDIVDPLPKVRMPRG